MSCFDRRICRLSIFTVEILLSSTACSHSFFSVYKRTRNALVLIAIPFLLGTKFVKVKSEVLKVPKSMIALLMYNNDQVN